MSTSVTPPRMAAPRASVVNRTHRVVRERARTLQVQRSRNRALLIPLAIASSLVIVLICAFWLMFDDYEVATTSLSDSRFHLPIILIWFLPVTGALLIIALLRRIRSGSKDEEIR